MPTILSLLSGAVTGLYDRLMQSAEPDVSDDGKVVIAFSVGESRAATRVELAVRDLPSIVEELKAFDPEKIDESRERTVADIIRSTLTVQRDPQGKVSEYHFKISDRPNTRTVVLRTAEWLDFIRFLEDVGNSADKIEERIREVTGANIAGSNGGNQPAQAK